MLFFLFQRSEFSFVFLIFKGDRYDSAHGVKGRPAAAMAQVRNHLMHFQFCTFDPMRRKHVFLLPDDIIVLEPVHALLCVCVCVFCTTVSHTDPTYFHPYWIWSSPETS